MPPTPLPSFGLDSTLLPPPEPLFCILHGHSTDNPPLPLVLITKDEATVSANIEAPCFPSFDAARQHLRQSAILSDPPYYTIPPAWHSIPGRHIHRLTPIAPSERYLSSSYSSYSSAFEECNPTFDPAISIITFYCPSRPKKLNDTLRPLGFRVETTFDSTRSVYIHSLVRLKSHGKTILSPAKKPKRDLVRDPATDPLLCWTPHHPLLPLTVWHAVLHLLRPLRHGPPSWAYSLKYPHGVSLNQYSSLYWGDKASKQHLPNVVRTCFKGEYLFTPIADNLKSRTSFSLAHPFLGPVDTLFATRHYPLGETYTFLSNLDTLLTYTLLALGLSSPSELRRPWLRYHRHLSNLPTTLSLLRSLTLLGTGFPDPSCSFFVSPRSNSHETQSWERALSDCHRTCKEIHTKAHTLHSLLTLNHSRRLPPCPSFPSLLTFPLITRHTYPAPPLTIP